MIRLYQVLHSVAFTGNERVFALIIMCLGVGLRYISKVSKLESCMPTPEGKVGCEGPFCSTTTPSGIQEYDILNPFKAPIVPHRALRRSPDFSQRSGL